VLGSNSRGAAREIDKLLCVGSLREGVICNKEGGKLYVYGEGASSVGVDEEILNICKEIAGKVENRWKKICLVTKDRYLRIMASYRGVLVEDYKTDKKGEEFYSGHISVDVEEETINEIYRGGEVVVDEISKESINMCVSLVNEGNSKHQALGIHKGEGRVEILPRELKALNIVPLNAEQRFALRLLLDPNIHLITLTGATGSGKTMLAVAASLQQVEDGGYGQLLLSRSEVPMGRSQGFLGGNIKEKTDPWLSGLYGCLENLVGCKDSGGKETGGYRALDFYLQKEIIRAEALAYIRGVTWINSVLILDEAQNTSSKELKAVLTRAGGDFNKKTPTKIVLLGDTQQIDNPYLDDASNGLCQVISSFKGWEHYGHLHLNKTVRSKLAYEAGVRL
jgi:PhoH-like ATPase